MNLHGFVCFISSTMHIVYQYLHSRYLQSVVADSERQDDGHEERCGDGDDDESAAH